MDKNDFTIYEKIVIFVSKWSKINKDNMFFTFSWTIENITNEWMLLYWHTIKWHNMDDEIKNYMINNDEFNKKEYLFIFFDELLDTYSGKISLFKKLDTFESDILKKRKTYIDLNFLNAFRKWLKLMQQVSVIDENNNYFEDCEIIDNNILKNKFDLKNYSLFKNKDNEILKNISKDNILPFFSNYLINE